MKLRFLALWIIVGTVSASASRPLQLSAQTAVTVRGLAWDSLQNVALAGAFVVLKGRTSYSAITDNEGLFHFDSVAPGKYTTSVQHWRELA